MANDAIFPKIRVDNIAAKLKRMRIFLKNLWSTYMVIGNKILMTTNSSFIKSPRIERIVFHLSFTILHTSFIETFGSTNMPPFLPQKTGFNISFQTGSWPLVEHILPGI